MRLGCRWPLLWRARGWTPRAPAAGARGRLSFGRGLGAAGRHAQRRGCPGHPRPNFRHQPPRWLSRPFHRMPATRASVLTRATARQLNGVADPSSHRRHGAYPVPASSRRRHRRSDLPHRRFRRGRQLLERRRLLLDAAFHGGGVHVRLQFWHEHHLRGVRGCVHRCLLHHHRPRHMRQRAERAGCDGHDSGFVHDCEWSDWATRAEEPSCQLHLLHLLGDVHRRPDNQPVRRRSQRHGRPLRSLRGQPAFKHCCGGLRGHAVRRVSQLHCAVREQPVQRAIRLGAP